jgi:hypothetical protein
MRRFSRELKSSVGRVPQGSERAPIAGSACDPRRPRERSHAIEASFCAPEIRSARSGRTADLRGIARSAVRLRAFRPGQLRMSRTMEVVG